MPPVAKKRPAKKPKLAVKTSEDGQSITFGEQPAIEPEEPARDPEDEENGAENDAEEDVEEEEPAAFDPLAEFRRASSVAAKAVKQEKERYTEIERHLVRREDIARTRAAASREPCRCAAVLPLAIPTATPLHSQFKPPLALVLSSSLSSASLMRWRRPRSPPAPAAWRSTTCSRPSAGAPPR